MHCKLCKYTGTQCTIYSAKKSLQNWKCYQWAASHSHNHSKSVYGGFNKAKKMCLILSSFFLSFLPSSPVPWMKTMVAVADK